MKTVYQLLQPTVTEVRDEQGNIITKNGKPVSVMSAVLRFKPASPKNGQWNEIPVKISPLLRSRIERESHRGLKAGDTFMSRFTSDNLSPNYEDCPYKIVKFTPIKDSDIPENYVLELVHERISSIDEIKDIFGQKEQRWKERWFTSKEFRRYVQVEVTKKIKECKDMLTIVVPNQEDKSKHDLLVF